MDAWMALINFEKSNPQKMAAEDLRKRVSFTLKQVPLPPPSAFPSSCRPLAHSAWQRITGNVSQTSRHTVLCCASPGHAPAH